MNSRVALLLLIPMLALGGAVLAWPDRDDGEKNEATETRIEFGHAPKAVQDAVKQAIGDAPIRKIEKVVFRSIAVYDVDFKEGDRTHSMVLAASGHIIKFERQMKAAELPESVRAAIAKKYPRSTVVEAESVTLYAFDVSVKVGDKKRSMQVYASGHFKHGGDDDDDDDPDDDDDDGDDDDDDD